MSRTTRKPRYPRDEWNSFDAYLDDETNENIILDIVPSCTYAYCKDMWSKATRDNRYDESSANKGFKNAAKRDLRRRNKRFCMMVMNGEEYDNEAYPRTQDQKRMILDWW